MQDTKVKKPGTCLETLPPRTAGLVREFFSRHPEQEKTTFFLFKKTAARSTKTEEADRSAVLDHIKSHFMTGQHLLIAEWHIPYLVIKNHETLTPSSINLSMRGNTLRSRILAKILILPADVHGVFGDMRAFAFQAGRSLFGFDSTRKLMPRAKWKDSAEYWYYFLFDHEAGHALTMHGAPYNVRGKKNLASFHESAADAYMAIRHIQRFGKDTGFLKILRHWRAVGSALHNSQRYMTCKTLDIIETIASTRDMTTLSPNETVALALRVAHQASLSQGAHKKMKAIFNDAAAKIDENRFNNIGWKQKSLRLAKRLVLKALRKPEDNPFDRLHPVQVFQWILNMAHKQRDPEVVESLGYIIEAIRETAPQKIQMALQQAPRPLAHHPLIKNGKIQAAFDQAVMACHTPMEKSGHGMHALLLKTKRAFRIGQ